MAMKKVLFLTSVFPPMGGSSSLRITRFVKYLPDYGYEPIILTTKSNTYYLNDPSLDTYLDDENILRVWGINPFFIYNLITKLRPLANWINRGLGQKSTGIKGTGPVKTRNYGFYKLVNFFWVPDFRIGWLPFAVGAGLGVFKKRGFDIILSTVPDNTTHLVGLILHRLTGKPWVTDFMDPWVENPFIASPTKYHDRLERFLERKVVESSSAVVSVSEIMTEKFIRRYPFLDSRKFFTVTNGFDPDDFKGIEQREGKRFSILHAGSFWAKKEPVTFLEALRDLLTAHPDIRNKVEVNFIGPSYEASKKLREKYGLDGVIKVTPFVHHKKVLDYMMNSDLLLLIPGLGEGTLTSKLFEYLAARRPILMLSQGNTEAGQILKKAGVGIVVDYKDVSEIKRKIKTLIDEYLQKGKIEVRACEGEINRYDAGRLTAELAGILDRSDA